MADSYYSSSFLNDLKLEEYSDRFLTQGYEGFADIARISRQDLEGLNVINEDHQRVILEAVNNLPIKSWLETFNLQQYAPNFIEEGVKTIKEVKALKATEDILDRLEILVPGHRKRFTLSVQSLQPLTTMEEPSGPFHPNTIAVGYWARPKGKFFERLEHDFLCVKGCFKSSKDDDKQSEMLEMLLDSASDVVTARQEIIDELGLEYIDVVDSHGIHTVAKKPLYKGYLKVGNSHWMDVEVQPEEYESIGSTVMKNFIHYINGTYHQWKNE